MKVFSKSLQEKIQQYLSRYETKRSAVIPVLHAIQDECGWIKEEHVECLARDYSLPKVQVREVLTFYSMFFTEEPKKYKVFVCDNISCSMAGASDVVSKVNKHIEDCKEQGKDSCFSVQGVPCLGVCDGAPAILVNKERYLHVTPEKAEEILAQYSDKS